MKGRADNGSSAHEPSSSQLYHARGLVLAAALVAMYVALVPLHTQDGANHRQVAVLLERLVTADAPDPVYEAHLGLLRTNVLFSGGYALAAARVGIPIQVYERLFVGASLLLLLLGYRSFLAEWAPRHVDLWVWVLPLTTHALFVTGMYNFLAATALTFPLLILLRRIFETPSGRVLAMMSLLAWLVFLAHPFAFFVLPIAWLWLVAGRRKRPDWYMWSAGGVLAAFLLMGFALPLVAGASPSNPYVLKPPLELVAGLVYYNYSGFSTWAILAAAPALVAAVALAWRSLLNGDGQRRGRLLWLAMFGAYFLFPNEGHGGAHLNERFLPFLWAFLPLGLSTLAPRRRSTTRWIRATAVSSSVLMAAVLWIGMNAVDQEVDDAVTVLMELPDEARLYPLEFDPMGPSLTHTALLHLWANHPTDRTVHSPFSFTFMDLMPVSRRIPSSPTYFPAAAENHAQRLADGRLCRPADPVSTPDCSLMEREGWSSLLNATRYYDFWFVHGAPDRWRRTIENVPGLSLVAEAGRASLWRYDRTVEFTPDLR
jgi:hypothetical protein